MQIFMGTISFNVWNNLVPWMFSWPFENEASAVLGKGWHSHCKRQSKNLTSGSSLCAAHLRHWLPFLSKAQVNLTQKTGSQLGRALQAHGLQSVQSRKLPQSPSGPRFSEWGYCCIIPLRGISQESLIQFIVYKNYSLPSLFFDSIIRF